MNWDFLLDPELRSLVRAHPVPDLSAATLPDLRASIPAAPANADLHMVPGPAGAAGVRVLGYRPAAADGTLPAILHLHGGGYVLGGPEMGDDANRQLASSLGCAVFSVAGVSSGYV